MKVGCLLPGGITIETGTPGQKDYAYYNVPGRVAWGRGFTAGIGEVPDVVANAWFKCNAELHFVKDRSVFRVNV